MFYHYLRGYPYFTIMTFSTDQWHVGIALFYGKAYVSIKVFNTNICLSSVCENLFSFVYCFYLFLFLPLLCKEDVESNPGPKKNKEFSLSCCHWNANSVLAHNCAKVTFLEGYNSVFKYDFICISETYLDSTISSDNKNLNISGYNLIRANHLSNSKRGDVCIYFKESLAVQALNNIGLPECLVCKVCLGNKTGYIVVTYRSPSQTYLEFQQFVTSFDTLLQNLQNLNLHFTMILDDFSARSYSWWSEDILSVE